MSTGAGVSQPLIYGLLSWPLAMLGIPLYVYLPSYYHQLGLELALVGSMLLLARISDIFTDPLVGWLCDYSGTRGRYALLILGWLLLLIGLWQLLLPRDVSAMHLLLWAMWVYLAWTLIMIPYQALSAQVSTIAHIKTHYTASREGFAILGVVSVLILPFLLADSQDYAQLFSVLYPLVSISLSLALALLLWRLRLLKSAATAPKQALFSKATFGVIWSDPGSRRLLPAYFLNSLANALPATLFLFFVEHVLQLDAYMGLLLLGFFLSGILALPLWVWLAQKIGKYAAWRLSMLSACVSFIWVFSLAPGNLWGFAAICLISGLSVAADVALPASIQADIAQDLSRKNGSLSGLLFALWGVLTKLSLALAVGLALPLLGWLGWEQRSELSLQALLWLYAGAPVLLKLIALYWLRSGRVASVSGTTARSK